jgi:hypothetical protein
MYRMINKIFFYREIIKKDNKNDNRQKRLDKNISRFTTWDDNKNGNIQK